MIRCVVVVVIIRNTPLTESFPWIILPTPWRSTLSAKTNGTVSKSSYPNETTSYVQIQRTKWKLGWTLSPRRQGKRRRRTITEKVLSRSDLEQLKLTSNSIYLHHRLQPYHRCQHLVTLITIINPITPLCDWNRSPKTKDKKTDPTIWLDSLLILSTIQTTSPMSVVPVVHWGITNIVHLLLLSNYLAIPSLHN